MSQESPIVKSSSFKQDIELDPVLDTRFQSFSRFYIRDILNADTSFCGESVHNSNKKGLIKINKILAYKVSIYGLIVAIYESEKFYRLKVDDSTGIINVTLWKSNLYNEDASILMSKSTNSNYREIYEALNSIQSRIKEKSINNNIMFEPKQGG